MGNPEMLTCADHRSFGYLISVDLELFAERYLHGVHGVKNSKSFSYGNRSSKTGDKSVLGKVQRTLSLSLLKSRTEASGAQSSTESGGGLFGGESGDDSTRCVSFPRLCALSP